MNDLEQNLEKVALSNSIAFCYSCYVRAPSGKCSRCGSDDLMREYPGCGVGYALDWIIREILREHLEPVDTRGAFEDFVADCYPEAVKIGWIECDVASTVKALDPVSWDLARSEWIDNEDSYGALVTFDSGSNYYRVGDVEQMIEDLAPES